MAKPNKQTADTIKQAHKEAQKDLLKGLKARTVTSDIVSGADTSQNDRTMVISNSDRVAFRKCRRAWDWGSHLRRGLRTPVQRSPLWFGSGFHYALEDFHGPKFYPSLESAWDDYVQATTKQFGQDNLPMEHAALGDLAHAMFFYYRDIWLEAGGRPKLKTLKVNGVPQVEVPLEFEVPVAPKLLKKAGFDRAVCRFIADRIVEDEFGLLWMVDYKALARFPNIGALELDPQITQYLLGVQLLYNRPFGGLIYQSHLKAACNTARELKPKKGQTRGDISCAANQGTCHTLYRMALIDRYGDVTLASDEQQELLRELRNKESEHADAFIRRDWMTRNQRVIANEAKNIVLDAEEMLDTPRIYHAPSDRCTDQGCAFYLPCVEKERGENFEFTLKNDYQVTTYAARSAWAQHLTVGAKLGKEAKETATAL